MREIPLARILIPFLLGIVIANFLLADLVIDLTKVLIFSSMAFFSLIIISKCINAHTRLILLIFPLIFFVGVVGFLVNNPLVKQDHFSYAVADKYEGIVVSSTTKNKTKLIVDIGSITKHNGITASASGRTIVYLDSIYKEVKHGDRIIFSGEVFSIRSAKNPAVFDYKKFLFYKKIHDQFFVKEGNWEIVNAGNLNFITQYSLDTRTWCLSKLRKYLKKKDNLSIASAMLLGYKEDISKEQKSAFSDTGAIHVLAVSGLHVGLLSQIIAIIFLLFPKRYKSRLAIESICKIIAIWFFVFITGSPPSVQRAATMFTLYYFGTLFSKRRNSYNILSAAALGMLVVDPYQLFMLSFQFSFLALGSILVFTKMFSDRITFKSWFADYAWKLFCVSLAAQVLIFPISIYYFHQFPIYFWLSSMIVIPAAFVIFGAAIAILIFELCLPQVNEIILGPFLDTFIGYVNYSIYTIQQFPYSKLEALHFDGVQMILLYSILACIIGYQKLGKKTIYLATGLFMVLQVYSISKNIKLGQQKSLIVYSIPKSSLIELMIGKESYILHRSNIDNDKYIAGGYRITKGIKKLNHSFLDLPDNINTNGPLFQMNGKVIYILNDRTCVDLKYEGKIDHLIIQNVTSDIMKQVIDSLNIEQVIIDGTVSRYKIQEWEASYKQKGIAYHNVITDGSIMF